MIYRDDRRQRSVRSGVAATEFAVLAPFLVFLLLVVVDFCRIFYYTQTVENCARNGAEYACKVFETNMQYSDVATATIADGKDLSPPLTTSNVQVVNGKDSNNNSIVTVTVKYTFKTITNFPGFPSGFALERPVQMRVAPQRPLN